MADYFESKNQIFPKLGFSMFNAAQPTAGSSHIPLGLYLKPFWCIMDMEGIPQYSTKIPSIVII